MSRIVGHSTIYGSMGGSDNVTVTYTTNTSSSMFVGPFYMCMADGNIYQLEPGERKRKYCSANCRYKVRDQKKKL